MQTSTTLIAKGKDLNTAKEDTQKYVMFERVVEEK